MFDISIDRTQALIRLAIVGPLTDAQADALACAQRRALVQLGVVEHLLLVDVSESPRQPESVVTRFAALIAAAERPARRIAVVTGGSPARMQARRILTRRDAMLFPGRDEAEAWLFG